MSLWEAREAVVNIGTIIATVDSTSTLASQVATTAFTSKIKSVKVSGGERDVESVPLLGETSGYANQEIFQKSVGSLREVSFTMVYDDGTATLLGTDTISTSGAAATYTRLQGDQDVTQKAVMITFTDGANIATVLLNNAYPIKLGDLSLDADGHLEQEITLKCLSKDYYEEYNF
jgi:hypothetical protein